MKATVIAPPLESRKHIQFSKFKNAKRIQWSEYRNYGY